MTKSKSIFASTFMSFIMIGFTSVSALTNTDFGYANGIMHGSRFPSSYSTFTFRDTIYSSSSGLYDATTGMANRYSGSYAQNITSTYAFTPVTTKTAGKEVTATNRLNSTQFGTHYHYGREH